MTNRLTLVEISTALGISKRGAELKAKRESWTFEEESVRGGRRRLYPVATLPAAIRTAVIAQRTESIVSSGTAVTPAVPFPVAPVATGLSIPCADLTDRQRHERDARSGIVAAIERLRAAGASQEAAITTLLTSARSGRLDPSLDAMLRLARDSRGRAGDGYPSPRTLKRWIATPDLTPKIATPDMTIPVWAGAFLRHYQQPQKPSVQAAYREWLKADARPGEIVPSVHQVRRLLAKLGSVTREKGRMGPRELKNIQPFIRRDFSLLEPNDIWTADGHTYDAEVQHPWHGRPFRPEITAILDIATRRAVGWSVDLAESSMAVLDALRYAVERNGIPAIFYVDNGSGYSNAMLKDEGTGLLGRIGTEIRHSLPYNSQARGVIERGHQTLFVQSAKQLPSYVGAAMDREARLEQFKLTRKAIKQGGAMPLIPWDVFVSFIEERVAEYNACAHRSLNRTSPDLAWAAFEARGWQAERVEPETLATLFRPRTTRVIARGEINYATNIYFAQELAEFHGLKAQIAYDIHDPSRIWVYTPEGRFICEAQANGNRRHYMPVPVIQQARERRAKGRLARVDAKRDEILEELHGATAITAPSADQLVIGGRVIDASVLSSVVAATDAAQPCDLAPTQESTPSRAAQILPPPSRSERSPEDNYAEWEEIDRRILAGESVTDADARWHRSYQGSSQYRVMAKKKAAA